jgi:transaldolase
MPSRLHALHDVGTSAWLDYIDRPMLLDGGLARRIREDALTGMTSNPTIFEKALAEGTAYDAQISAAPDGRTPWELFELVAVEDVRTACDIFAGVHRDTKGVDGYVSLEVSPGSAHDADATVEEAHRLWAAVDRPNVMIKVPGTDAGTQALRRLIADGVNVNVTLLFSIDAHRRTIESYIAGLEDRARRGEPLDHLASVASFFVSRVDTEIDGRLQKMAAAASGEQRAKLEALQGRAAIANAKLAYRLFREEFGGARFAALAAKGARVQRPLWASTGTKNPKYSDVLYVEELAGPDTVNTLPPATLAAFQDHGRARRAVDQGVDEAMRTLAALEAVGISLQEVTDKLLRDGLASFQKSFDSLLAGLERKTASLGRTVAAR